MTTRTHHHLNDSTDLNDTYPRKQELIELSKQPHKPMKQPQTNRFKPHEPSDATTTRSETTTKLVFVSVFQ